MDSTRYEIYFRGEIADGQNLETVKSNLAKVFQADGNKIDALFSGKTCLLKKDLDKTSALKYQTILKQAGAKIIIKTAQTPTQTPTQTQAASAVVTNKVTTKVTTTITTTQQPITSPASQTQPQTSPAASPSESDDFDLAPVGSELLKPEERKAVEPVQIDISGIKLASVFVDISNDQQSPPPPAPDTSHISLAEAGVDLLPEHATEMDLPFPDVSHLNIDEVGVRLSDEKIDSPLPEPDLSALSLAPTGERLSQQRKDAPPPPPDTSHLQLKSDD